MLDEAVAAMAKKPVPSFQSVDVLRMFPTFVWKASLGPEVSGPLNQALLRTLGEAGAPLDDLRPGESWQSDHKLHEGPGISGLSDHIEAAAEAVLEHLKISHEGFRVTGCWANVNAPGAEHRPHSHPNNYLSGVYYVQVAEGADSINFHDPRPQVGIIRPPVRELTAENADQVTVMVKDGDLLLFPGWLQHSVDANLSRRPRISISFNVMFAAYAEVMGRPQWQGGRRGPS